MSASPTEPVPAEQSSARRAGAGRSRRSPILLIVGAVLLLALAGGGTFALFSILSDNNDDALDDGTATASGLTATEVSDPVEEITFLLQGIGYEQIIVEERDGTIYLSGPLGSQADIAAVITASTSLSDGRAINADGLALSPTTPAGPASNEPTTADPLQRLQVVINRTVAAAPIIFDSSETEIAEWHTDTLDMVADILLDNPGIAITVVGFTDESGPVSANLALSLDRAEAVRQYLTNRGVAEGLLNIEARGESEATGLRDVGYLERRVEFEVVAAPEVDKAALRPLDVGVIVPSPGDDLAFSQSMVDAVAVLQSERGGLTTTITDNMFDVDQAKDEARRSADSGADVVILHGAQFGAIVDELAAEFPDVVFVTGPGELEIDRPNVFVYVVAAEQGAYVLGDMAGQLSSSQVIGVVGPVEVPEPMKFIGGFRAGAENHQASVMIEYVGSFNDAEAGREMAQRHLDAGADVLTGTSQLTVGPIEVAVERNVPWFANQANQTELAPNNVVASQVYHFEVALREILAEIDAQSTTGGTFPLTLGNGGVLLEFNENYELTDEVRARADELLFAVTAGSVIVNYQ